MLLVYVWISWLPRCSRNSRHILQTFYTRFFICERTWPEVSHLLKSKTAVENRQFVFWVFFLFPAGLRTEHKPLPIKCYIPKKISIYKKMTEARKIKMTLPGIEPMVFSMKVNRLTTTPPHRRDKLGYIAYSCHVKATYIYEIYPNVTEDTGGD